jgi:hypothetical protein
MDSIEVLVYLIFLLTHMFLHTIAELHSNMQHSNQRKVIVLAPLWNFQRTLH